MLWNKGAGINYSRLNVVSEPLGQYLFNHGECTTLIVALQVLHILEYKRPRPMRLDDSFNLEEKCSLCLTLEPMRSAKRVVLRDTS